MPAGRPRSRNGESVLRIESNIPGMRDLSLMRSVDINTLVIASSSPYKEVLVSDIFGSILGSALRGLAGQGGTGALSDILSQVLGKTDLGSIGGLLQQLQQSGLGPQVASWLGKRGEPAGLGRSAERCAGRSASAPARSATRPPGRPIARPIIAAFAGRRRSHEPARNAGRAARSGVTPSS